MMFQTDFSKLFINFKVSHGVNQNCAVGSSRLPRQKVGKSQFQKKTMQARWFMPIIPATQEAEIEESY
jgi:hypothetical protein